MVHTQPTKMATVMAMPSHAMGCWYQWLARSMALFDRVMTLMGNVIDVGCQHVDLIVAEALVPSRHVALAPVVDGLVDIRHGAAPFPRVVGEVGRAHGLVSGAVGAMAGGTGGFERRFGPGGHGSVVFASRQ